MQNRPFCIHLSPKKRIGMQNAEFCIPINQKTYVLSESVADTEAEALPAKAGAGNQVEERLPVKGYLEREAGEDVLETELCTYTKNEVIIFAAAHPNMSCRACIESERTYGSNLEVVSCTNAEGVCTPTGINLEEVLCTKSVLIGNFATPTNADTECAGLCACECYKCEHCNNNCKNLFHKNKVLVIQMY